ncbi:MAG TPA: hypothetical protein VF070_11005 [Streptosporangiaceae bacterium]
MISTNAMLSARAQRMADNLRAWPRRRIQLAELRELLDQVDPSSRMDVRRRGILSELITELAAANLAELPAARSYDRSEIPALPRFLTLPCGSPAPEPRKAVVLHPSLAWVPKAGLTRSQVRTVELVNQWLHDSRDHLVVPSRERSLEVFGDEKALDRLLGTALFGPGRLSLELLRCRRVAPRLYCESAGEGDLLLVVENSDTFDSLVTVLRGRGDHRVGLVGWGAGTGFEASVLSIARIERTITEVRYFGDLDENGLRVPANAAALAASTGLPPVHPAAGLYGVMLRWGAPRPGQRKLSAEAAAGLASWLGPGHQAQAVRLLVAGERLAQEAVGLSYLSRHGDWLEDLRIPQAPDPT